MSKVQKAIEISNAKIQFVSLVDKAANKRQFLVTKQEGGQAQFSTYSKILKVDADTHYITGIVYEPLTEDAHGNYMTEDEIRKAAYWFAKNGDNVDLQHSFESADGLAVVENYVSPSDLTIGDTPVVKGSWVITVECANDEVWQAVQKGDLTGFSMGGIGKYSEEDVDLENVSKGGSAANTEKKSLLKRLGEFLGMDIVEKGEVLDKYNESTKRSAFWNAMWALEDVLYRYNWGSDRYEFASDEATIREALEDFNKILTTVLSDSGTPIIKAVALPVTKAGKKMSGNNKAKLDEICQALSDFKSSFDEDEDEEGTIEKKEEHDMNRAETEAVVGQAVRKALEDAGVLKADTDPAAGTEPAAPPAAPAEPVQKDASPAAAVATDTAALAVDLDAAVEKAVAKALISLGLAEEAPDPNAPVTKSDIERIVQEAMAPMLKAFSVPSNLNDKGVVEKADDGTNFLRGLL